MDMVTKIKLFVLFSCGATTLFMNPSILIDSDLRQIINLVRNVSFFIISFIKMFVSLSFMSDSFHVDRASNVENGVECQIFVIVFNWAEFHNLGHIQGIISRAATASLRQGRTKL